MKQPTYRSYLLRLWQTTNQKNLRASLFNVHDPVDQQHFVTIDDLYVFLRTAHMSTPGVRSENQRGSDNDEL